MAVTTFVSFSALVAVSAGFTNGSVPAPWQAESASEQADFGESSGTGRGASLFAAAPDTHLISQAGKPSDQYVASQTRNVAERGTGTAPSSVAPSHRAPATFEGELPVNTLIAPAQPATVLSGGEFGWRVGPDNGKKEFHNGTDVSAPEGSPVVAAMDGTVTAVFWDVWGGNRVEVSHADGMKTTYNHLKDVQVRVGDPLKASEQLGTVGQTGQRVTGPHLHFETWVGGKVVDAQSFDWETGHGVIPASRPQYSMEDQAPADPGGQVIAAANDTKPTTAPAPKGSSDPGTTKDPGADEARVTASEKKAPAQQPKPSEPSAPRDRAADKVKAAATPAPAAGDVHGGDGGDGRADAGPSTQGGTGTRDAAAAPGSRDKNPDPAKGQQHQGSVARQPGGKKPSTSSAGQESPKTTPPVNAAPQKPAPKNSSEPPTDSTPSGDSESPTGSTSPARPKPPAESESHADAKPPATTAVNPYTATDLSVFTTPEQFFQRTQNTIANAPAVGDKTRYTPNSQLVLDLRQLQAQFADKGLAATDTTGYAEALAEANAAVDLAVQNAAAKDAAATAKAADEAVAELAAVQAVQKAPAYTPGSTG